MVEILKKYGITEYKSIDILENNIIREQVKVYSKWPTYPQLYINGELIGGSDILHEMHKDQSLQKLLEENGLIWLVYILNISSSCLLFSYPFLSNFITIYEENIQKQQVQHKYLKAIEKSAL